MKKKKVSLQGRHLEFLTSLYATVFGLWLLNPIWESFKTASIFHNMSHVAPEWAWGIGIMLVGIFQMSFLFTDKMKFRALASFLCTFLFVTLSMMASVSNIQSTAGPSFAVIALCSWLGYTEILNGIKEKKQICK